jgi:DNA invertase Pin-like site-specific DNA recombinase
MTVGDLVPHRGGLVSEKILRQHRERLAIVYIRQSTPQQVERHQESTRLQYALVDRAFQFGWPRETIVVIDDDLGRTGTTIEGRLGFQRLIAEVSLGHVGLVLGIETSRLARSCRDWHQLLELCALFDTLIADTDGVYDPANYNDRLVLGLKGTMSEAELHILKARMLEGRRAKARRGELGKPVPMGYVRRPSGEVILDPDEHAQGTIRLVFDLFDRFRTVGRVMRYLIERDIRMPVRVSNGPHKGDLEWHRVNRASLHNLFANPTYAGAYVYGMRPIDRRRQQPGRKRTGRRSYRLEDTEVVLPGRLPAYITWEQYQRNRAQLQSNRPASTGPVRAGSALLSGLLICGRCGLRMNAQYNNNGHTGRYSCMHMKTTYGEPSCQSLTAAPLDALVTSLVLQALQPAALEASVALAKDLEAERAALDHHWRQRLERARYHAERARRQYEAVEPENRLVCRTVERAWEEALAEQARLESEYDRFRRARTQAPSPTELAAVQGLAKDLTALWNAQTTSQEERQTIVRLVLERVLVEVIEGSEQVRVECHWHGGNQTSHKLTRPVARMDTLSTYADLVARAGELRKAGHSFERIATVLNQEGWRPAKRADSFNAPVVRQLLIRAGVVAAKYRRRGPQFERETDEWTIRELAEQIGVPATTVYGWVHRGRLPSRSVKTTATRPMLLVRADAATIVALNSRIPAG